MKSLISINYKFMDIHPKDLTELITKSKYCKGVEIYIDNNDTNQTKYLENLIYELKRNNLILQVHGEIEIEFEKQLDFIKQLERYSDELGYPIVVTFHPIFNHDKNVSINKTIDYITNLISKTNCDKITICLENLNDIRGYIRLNKEDLKETILNDEKVYFTYDVGHEISNYGKITDLDNYMIQDIRNVHIHTFENGVDHYPIYKNDSNWNLIMKALEFLILNKYEYNIVYEYGLEYCSGNNTIEKIQEYLNSIDIVSEKYSEK